MAWTNARQPFGPNRAPLLVGLSVLDGKTPVPIAVDPDTGELFVNAGGGGGGGSGTNANLYTGQKTVSTSAVQISSSSHALSNGILVKAPSTNADVIYVGLTGVTTGTGDMLEPGETRGYAVNNTNLLYIISPTSTTDIITYSGN